MKKRKELKRCISKTFKLGAIFILLTSMLVLVGCSGKENKKPKEAKTAEKMLKEKYNEEFVTYSVGGRWGTLTNSTFTAICSPKDNPDLKFKAEIDKDGAYMLDEYVTRKVSYSIEKSLTDYMGNNFEDFYIRVGATFRYTDLNKSNMSIEDLYRDHPDARFIIDIVIDNKNLKGDYTKNLYNNINSVIKTNPQMKGKILIYIVTNDTYQKIINYVKDRLDIDSEFDQILKGSKSFNVEVTDGTMDMTFETFEAKFK